MDLHYPQNGGDATRRETELKIRDSYRLRSPSNEASADIALEYHLGRLLEFTWNANTYSEVKARNPSAGRTLIGTVDTDLYCCIEICAEMIEETLPRMTGFPNREGFLRCWKAFSQLIKVTRVNKSRIGETIARQIFLLLFVASKVLKESFVGTHEIGSNAEEVFLKNDDLFNAKAFPLADSERILVGNFPYPLFGDGCAAPVALERVCGNLESLASSAEQ